MKGQCESLQNIDLFPIYKKFYSKFHYKILSVHSRLVLAPSYSTFNSTYISNSILYHVLHAQPPNRLEIADKSFGRTRFRGIVDYKIEYVRTVRGVRGVAITRR